MRLPKMTTALLALLCFGLVAASIAPAFGDGDPPRDVPDPSLCQVDPWDATGQPLVSPGAGSVDEVAITIRNAQGLPIADAIVTIDLSDCSNLCIDFPEDGLGGITNQNGQVYLNPRVGGCDDCQVDVRANGYTIRAYTAGLVSTDWNGYEADGHVAAADFSFFAGAYLGSNGSCADYDGNGIVNMVDLARIALAYMRDYNDWPCYGDPETGVCCFEETCEIVSEQACVAWGGIWIGLQTCASNPCREPQLGACCFPLGGPCQVLEELECYQNLGIWDGYESCQPDPCPENLETGAACPPPGLDVFDDTHAAFLFDVPGAGLGPRPIIASGPTTVLRQYRVFEPNGPCVIETRMLTLDLEGIFNPDCTNPTGERSVSIHLDPTSPTLGSINSSDDGNGNPDFPAESFFDVYVEIDIEGLGVFPHLVEDMGNLLHDDNLWDYHPCVHPSDPYTPPSPTHGHFPCPDSLPTGCCVVGTNEFYTNQAMCTVLGGTYLGDGSICPGCGPQACCYPDGNCQMLPPDQCQETGGTPWGGGTVCDTNPCPVGSGACCFGEVCAELEEQTCARLGGIWMGLPTCSPNPCKEEVPGACCFGPECAILMEVECSGQGGAWDGAEFCAPNPCPQDEALGPPCPPPGLDIFDDTWAAFWFDAPGLYLGPRAVIAHGPTAVLRSFRRFDQDGPCTIDTEILELNLTGVLNPDCRDPLHEHPVTIRLDPQMPTVGSIVSSDDGMGNPDFPDDSFFDVHVEIEIPGVGVFQHSVEELGNLLHDGDLWADPPCVHPSDPYQPPSSDHAHIPCPDSLPPTGCCVLGPNEFYTYQVLCDALGGTYLGDGAECPDGCPYISGVADGIVEGIAIGEITPNPSFGTVQLTYELEAPARPRIDLFDANGRLVRTFAVGEQGAGEHEFVWDGKDRRGRDLPAGVYFLTLRAGSVQTTRGFVLLR